jgi:hypothetical protein
LHTRRAIQSTGSRGHHASGFSSVHGSPAQVDIRLEVAASGRGVALRT